MCCYDQVEGSATTQWDSDVWINACPTLLRHTWYRASEQYPNGMADIPGYWAESRIFGGVVLFDRFEKATSSEAEAASTVWLHPTRRGGTYRIVKLNEDQRQALVEFLLSDSPDMNLLPILASKSNLTREDPKSRRRASVFTGIYGSAAHYETARSTGGNDT